MSTLNAASLVNRHKKLSQALQAASLQAMLVNPGPSINYLTGMHFHLSERPIIAFFTPGNPPSLALPELEAAKTHGLPYELNVFTYGEDPASWGLAFQQAAAAAGLSRAQIGVEDRVLRLLELRILQGALPQAEFVPAEHIMASLRMFKDPSEVNAMQQAAQIAQKALQATLPLIKTGMRESEVAAELTLQILRQGSSPTLPFMPIVASGPHNSANPHAFPGERRLASGDLLVIDWGANQDGYFSDLTRSFGIGEISAELAAIHQVVQQANAAARAAVKPGTACAAVDQAARTIIENAGFGQYFIHRTGHGLGMEVHEEPYIRAGNPMILEPGMTFTIEPGIYIPGKGGVRIEDNVVVTEDGLQSFSDMPRELLSIG
ncbi:MAG: aminopeptidase P family protein [Anaerolineae bacterium]|nr:aminopeptidase P family protein [Anaerolineae bacterium]